MMKSHVSGTGTSIVSHPKYAAETPTTVRITLKIRSRSDNRLTAH